jgi:hypothetical protein
MPLWQLLKRPLVAVRVGEEDKPAPVEVLDVADLGPALDKLRVRGLDVGDHHLQAAHAPRLALDDAPADRDRAGRPGRGVPDLRANPLLLSLMCILYRGEGSLPRNRAEVYEQCANLLFHRWDARRHIHQDLRVGHLLQPALQHLAWCCRRSRRSARKASW